MNYTLVSAILARASTYDLSLFLKYNDYNLDKFLLFIFQLFNEACPFENFSIEDFDMISTIMLVKAFKKNCGMFNQSVAYRVYVYHHLNFFLDKDSKESEIKKMRIKVSFHTGETLESVGGS